MGVEAKEAITDPLSKLRSSTRSRSLLRRGAMTIRGTEEHRAALRQIVAIGVWTWPLFFFADLAGAWLLRAPADLVRLAVLRAIGQVAILGAHRALTAGKLSRAALVAIDAGLWLLGGVLITLIAVPFGVASTFVLGIFPLIAVRLLVPMHWRTGLVVASACASAYPLTMGVLCVVDSGVRAAWSSPVTRGAGVHTWLFMSFVVGLGVLGSHVVWLARRQVQEARSLGNYRLKARIGAGGMGDVWLARQESLGRDVALKILNQERADDDSALLRFEREARATSKLVHPSVVRIYDFGASDDGVFYIAMELLDGFDLRTLLQLEGAMAPSRVIHLARQVCGALAEAHEAGIVHRDIKPANLFVARQGEKLDLFKIFDFGVARMRVEGSMIETESGVVVGTPSFMAPEAAYGEEVDARADIYSFGCVLYAMISGRMPFPGSVSEVMLAHLTKVPERPSDNMGVALPRDLEEIVMRCLEKEPGRRFASARELDEALAACADAGRWTEADAAKAWARTEARMHHRKTAESA